MFLKQTQNIHTQCKTLILRCFRHSVTLCLSCFWGTMLHWSLMFSKRCKISMDSVRLAVSFNLFVYILASWHHLYCILLAVSMSKVIMNVKTFITGYCCINVLLYPAPFFHRSKHICGHLFKKDTHESNISLDSVHVHLYYIWVSEAGPSYTLQVLVQSVTNTSSSNHCGKSQSPASCSFYRDAP